ncbi:MAG: enolase C-terminal domain-like protein [Balneolales bacterium]
MSRFSRRKFITGTTAAAASILTPGFASHAKSTHNFQASPESKKIERIETFPVRYPSVMPFKFLDGPGGTGRPAVLVKITADDGSVGWGESVPVPRWSYETLEASVIAIDKYLAPVLKGQNPFDLKGINGLMSQEIAPSFATGMPITKSGIDMALHDLMGKITGRNIAELWGRTTGDEIELSWTISTTDLGEAEDLVQQGLEEGFRHFNVKVGPNLDYDLKLVDRVKGIVPESFLWADANGGYDLSTALDAAPKLADAGVPVLEQPIPISQITGYQRLVSQGALPIIVDEGMVTPALVLEFIKLECMDGVAMKPARTGGLLSARQQIEMLEHAGLQFLGSGLTDPDVSLAASLILYSAYDLNYPAALNGPQFLAESIITEPFRPVNGKVRVPKGPGLGVQVDEDKLNDLVRRSKTS